MKHLNTYYYFKSALSEKICDDIVKEGKSANPQIGLTGEGTILNKSHLRNIQNKRKSNVSWISGLWLEREIAPYVKKANERSGWNFDIIRPQAMQFTSYDEGDYYGWHTDSDSNGAYPKHHEDAGLMRKLSVTISLSNPEDYDGGLLEFDTRHSSEPNLSNIVRAHEILSRGSICVFPSYTWHRVAPITMGTRLSLVIWFLGYPWR